LRRVILFLVRDPERGFFSVFSSVWQF